MYKRYSPYTQIWASKTQNVGKSPYQFLLLVSDECGQYIQDGLRTTSVCRPIPTTVDIHAYTFDVAAKTEPVKHILIG